MNREWLERLMASRGITYYALKNEFHFSPDNFKHWEAGAPARAFSLRKLARIFQIDYMTLVRGLQVRVLNRRPPLRKPAKP